MADDRKRTASPFDGLLGLKPGKDVKTTSQALVVDGKRITAAYGIPALAARLAGSRNQDSDADAADEALLLRQKIKRELDRVRAAESYQRRKDDPEFKAKRKEWQAKNREERREYLRKYRATHGDRLREQQSAWQRRKYHQDPEKFKAAQRDYYARNREAILARLKAKKAAEKPAAPKPATAVNSPTTERSQSHGHED